MSSKSIHKKIWEELKYLDFIVAMSIICITILLLVEAVPRDSGLTAFMTLLSWIFSSQYRKNERAIKSKVKP